MENPMRAFLCHLEGRQEINDGEDIHSFVVPKKEKRTMKTRLMLGFGMLPCFCLVAFLHAQSPQLLNYQGNLVIDGNAAQGPLQITFTVYDAPTGGAILWSERQTVTVNNGIFNVLLGNGDTVLGRPKPSLQDLFSGTGDRFLTLQVEGRPELQSRFRIASVAYALQAGHADSADVAKVALSNGAVVDGYSLDAADGSPTDAVYVDNNGNVGIGTTIPSQRLSVVGSESSPDGFGAAIGLRNTATGGRNWYLRAGATGTFTPAGGFSIADDADYRFVIDQSGNTGIGTKIPTQKLHVDGNILATGSITPGSSREFKENVVELSAQEAELALQALTPIKFNYKADEQKDQHIGFIAEEVPDLLATPDRKGVNPMDVVALLTKVVQEQQKEIAALREEVKALQQKN